ncbi:MAG: hypothetical protein ACYCUV_09955 [Phycisphaerae bacterium]
MNDAKNPPPLQNPFIDVPQNAARRLVDRATKTAALGGVLLTISLLAGIFLPRKLGIQYPAAISTACCHFFTAPE